MRAAEVTLHIAARDVREIGPALVGDDKPGLADGTQQPARQRAGARTGFEHPRTGADVGHGQDLRGVLRVDDRGAPGHRQGEVRQQRPERHRGSIALDDRTTLPSGLPMRSSSAMEPRWVWNSLPGCKMARWRRPLGSVSWAWSPGANGPRREIIPDRVVRGAGEVTEALERS